MDSTPAVARVWSWWARRHGFDPIQTVHQAHGRPSVATIRELLPNADHEAENREVERREILDVEGVIPLAGVTKLLTSLPTGRWTIVTSCTKPLADVRLRVAGIAPPPQFITAADITVGKPDPEPVPQRGCLAWFCLGRLHCRGRCFGRRAFGQGRGGACPRSSQHRNKRKTHRIGRRLDHKGLQLAVIEWSYAIRRSHS